MNRVISTSGTASLLILLAAAPAVAGPASPALLGDGGASSGAQTLLVGFDDGSSGGSRHSKGSRSNGASTKPIEPSHADLNGATREGADKAYRKQYGF